MKHQSHSSIASGFVVLGVVLALTAAASAGTMTFATFADPAANSASPSFQMADDYSSLSAAWSGPGLTLEVPFAGQVYTDVRFLLTGSDPAQPGYVDFWNNTGPIMQVAFASATLSEFGFGARDTTAAPGRVEITYYPWGSFNPTNESFAFSFSNFVDDGQGRITATAAFTSSAIPEPATLAFLAMGCLPLIRRR